MNESTSVSKSQFVCDAVVIFNNIKTSSHCYDNEAKRGNGFQ